MLSLEKFNTEDIKHIKAIPKRFKVTIIIFAIFSIPLSFLFGFLGLLKNGYGYWLTTSAFLLFSSILLLWRILVDYLAFKKDIKSSLKMCGSITITRKSAKKGDITIYTDSTQLKKVSLNSKDIFDRIQVGDKLKIGISKYSKEVLSLEKNGRSLLNGH